MPRIYVEWIKGRSEEQRNQLAERITEAVVEIAQVEPEAITIVFRENEPDKLYKGGIRSDKK